jgi:hypothetical protein
MKQLFNSTLFGAAITVAVVCSSAQAQTCTAELEGTLVSCIDNAIQSCDSSVTECDAQEVSATVADAEEDAVAKCCGKNAKKARKACLSSLARRYRGGRGTVVTDLLRESKQKILELRRTDCYGDAYSQLF